MQYTVDDAALLYIFRKERIVAPQGWYNQYGGWSPDEHEKQSCCDAVWITPRSKRALYNHCRDLPHVAQLLNVDYTDTADELRRTHWRVIKRALASPRKLVDGLRFNRFDRPTIHECAPALTEQVYRYAQLFKAQELKAFTRWIEQYYPDAGKIHWESARVINALQW